MQTIQASIEIDAPVEKVWELASDTRRYPEWVHFVREIVRADVPAGEGAVYVERAKPGPKEGIYEWRIVAWEPPRRQVHVHSGSELEAELTIQVEPVGGRTRYGQRMRFRALPGFRPLGFLLERTVMKRKMRGDFRRILATFKRIAEAEA
jgi:uncharacterized protein YndB with AHSA1/START domain